MTAKNAVSGFFGPFQNLRNYSTPAHSQRCFNRLCNAGADTRFDDYPVHHHFNVVCLVAVQLHALVELLKLAINPYALETLLADLLK